MDFLRCWLKRVRSGQNTLCRAQAGRMKKSFPFSVPGHQPPRVVESIKNDVRKYLKRERRKELPEGVDFWDFNCRVGQGDAEPVPKHVEEIIPAIDEAAACGCAAVYLEIIATPGHRKGKAVKQDVVQED
jgi:hypothetical protein